MKIIYGGFDFSALGELTVTQKRAMEGGEQTQRARVELAVRVDLFERGYDHNFSRVEQLRAALAVPNGVLIWRNDAAGVDYVNQTAALQSDDLPETWGEYHQALNLVFLYYEQAPGGATNNLPLKFFKEGSANPFKFDVVNRWALSAGTERFSRLRKHRRETHAKLRVEGQIFGDTRLALDQRRAALAAAAAQMNEQLNSAQGTLQYGENGSVFSHRVRIEEFTAQLDQLVSTVNWSFSAVYTMLPDEADYSSAEFTIEEKDSFTGQVDLVFSGRIQAQDEAAANAKLDAIVAAVTVQRGYTDGQQVSITKTPNAISSSNDGDTFTELAFSAAWRRWKKTNQQATFKRSGSLKPAVTLGEIHHWRDHYSAQRFNDMRSQRRHAKGSVEASGTFRVDASLETNDRRAQLLAMQRALKQEVNCADGTLTFGDWSQVLRVEDFQAEVNQAETGIEWSLSANYSLFPNEGGYATAEFTIAQRESVEEGDEFMTFAGHIDAPSAALALAKLNTLRTAVMAAYGWRIAQRIRDESVIQNVFANGDKTAGVPDAADGTTFITLTFNDEFRRRIQGKIVGSNLSVSSREDVPAQSLITTYSGVVMATGQTADAAYASALDRARQLGANREAAIDSTAYLRMSVIGYEQRQVTQDNPAEFLRLNFSYEYVSKISANRVFIEMGTTAQRNTFGADAETCNGFVAARDAAAAQAAYESQVRVLYASRIIQEEDTTLSQTLNQTPGGGYNTQHVRLDFRLSVFSPKLKGSIGLRYAVEVSRDFLTQEQRTVVQGSVTAGNRAVADDAVSALLKALKFGNNVRSRRNEESLQTSGAAVMLKLDFEEEFLSRITGDSGVIEMQLTERITYSATRWVVQPLPFDSAGGGGVSIPQPTGVEPGSRVVSGSVTSATLASAEAWAKRQRALLTGDKLGGRYTRPEQWDRDYQFVPRIDGIPADTQTARSNVRLYRVSFQFEEILPYYPAPA